MEMFFFWDKTVKLLMKYPCSIRVKRTRNLLKIVLFNIIGSFVGFRCEIMLEYMNDIDYLNMCINCANPPMYHNGKKRRFITAYFYSMPKK